MPRKEKVQEMFDNIAPTYDKLNHVLSMNVDKLWRRHALKEIVDGTPQRIQICRFEVTMEPTMEEKYVSREDFNALVSKLDRLLSKEVNDG